MLSVRTCPSHIRSLPLLFLFVLLNLTKFQCAHALLHSSNIEIIPKEANLSVSTVANFICINHQQSPGSSLEVNLSKTIPAEQIKFTTQTINQTTISVQLQLIDYIGYFHLLCYVKGEQSRGNLADIYVKDAPGTIRLVKPCRVYDRKYMKCQFEAPTIARALQNDYPGLITFLEFPSSFNRLAYKPRVEFFKNESTERYLVYVWKPNTEGVFPDQIPMRLQQQLEYFDSTEYRFTISRVFVVEPKFMVETSTTAKIKIDLTQLPSAVFCKKSIAPKASSKLSRTWTPIDLTKRSILINNCSSNTIYEVCLTCREENADPDGPEHCIEIRTPPFSIPWPVLVIFISCVVFAAIVVIAIVLTRKRCHKDHSAVSSVHNTPLRQRSRASTIAGDHESEIPVLNDVFDNDQNQLRTSDPFQITPSSVTFDGYSHVNLEEDIGNACDAKILSPHA